MAFSDDIKLLLRDKKDDIQILQLAVTSGVASLIYSEYIRNFNQRLKPTRKIFVADIQSVIDIVKHDSEFMKAISDRLIEFLRSELSTLYEDKYIPELDTILNSNIEVLKTVLELYILPNVETTIPKVIKAKFSLGDESNQTFFEDGEIKLFNGKTPSLAALDFVLKEISLHLRVLVKPMISSITLVENNEKFEFDYSNNNSCISIANDNAITSIYLSASMINNEEIIKLISFVTSTTFEHYPDDKKYIISSTPFNTLAIIQFS